MAKTRLGIFLSKNLLGSCYRKQTTSLGLYDAQAMQELDLAGPWEKLI